MPTGCTVCVDLYGSLKATPFDDHYIGSMHKPKGTEGKRCLYPPLCLLLKVNQLNKIHSKHIKVSCGSPQKGLKYVTKKKTPGSLKKEHSQEI